MYATEIIKIIIHIIVFFIFGMLAYAEMLFFFFQIIGHIINIENLLYEVVVNTYFMQFHTRNLSILSIYVFFLVFHVMRLHRLG